MREYASRKANDNFEQAPTTRAAYTPHTVPLHPNHNFAEQMLLWPHVYREGNRGSGK